MLSDEKLKAFFKLQQLTLDTEDNSEVLNKLLTEILTYFPSLGFTYEFISTSFLDKEKKVMSSFYIDIYSHKLQTNMTESILLLPNLLKKGSILESEILSGKVVVTDQVAQLISNSYFDFSHIKTLIISPTKNNIQINGFFILGCSRVENEINEEEVELINLVTNLISIAFRLQDTQNSLIKITQDVYKMNAQLHNLDKLKDDFVSVASHELRTPMTAIRSYAWMALYRSDIPLTEKLKKYLTRTLVSTERLIELVNDMLNISRIESGRIEIIPTAFDIQQLVRDVVAEVEVKAREKSIKIQLVETNLPPMFADPDKVHQVLLNLIGNALKFTPENGNIAISFFSDGISTEISIKDSGVGVSKDDLSRLFKKFGRLDNSYVAAATSGGTGLGLFICKNLIELMKGKIWAFSEGTGKGSVFSFSLPVATREVVEESEKYTRKVKGEVKELESVVV